MKCRMSPSWPIALGVDDLRVAEAGDRHEPEQRPARSSVASFLPAQPAGIGKSTRQTLPLGSSHSCGRSSLGSSRRITWSVVQEIIATVEMPRRW